VGFFVFRAIFVCSIHSMFVVGSLVLLDGDGDELSTTNDGDKSPTTNGAGDGDKSPTTNGAGDGDKSPTTN
jgi:hypothetical protein